MTEKKRIIMSVVWSYSISTGPQVDDAHQWQLSRPGNFSQEERHFGSAVNIPAQAFHVFISLEHIPSRMVIFPE